MTPTLQDILSQDRWLRRTALALTGDARAAEDLAQDAWVAGLEQERTSGGDRPWFRGLLRHRLASKRRAAASLRAKARRSIEVGPHAAAPTDELAEDAELRQTVALAILKLDEPMRRAVYLRFIAGQSNAEVARETGVAESTASQRISRGLSELRRRLDATIEGGRAVWAPALLRIVARPEAVPATGFGATGIAVAAVLLTGGATAALWKRPAGGGLSMEPPVAAATGKVQEGVTKRPRTGPSKGPSKGPAEQGNEKPAYDKLDPESSGARSALQGATGGFGQRRDKGAPPPAVRVFTVPASKTRNQTPELAHGPQRMASDGAITVQVVKPIHFWHLGVPLDETRVLLVSEGTPRRVQHPTRTELEPSIRDSFDLFFDAPSPGSHRVEILDPRFDPYVSEPVSPGDKASVRLVGSASLTLNVQAPAGLYPTDMEVTLAPKEFHSTASFVVPILGGGLIDDLTPCSYTLTVRAREGTDSIDVDDLAPQENRTVQVRLAPRARVNGRLDFPDGHPATGTLVQLVRYRGAHRPGTQIAEVGEFWSIPPRRVAVSETVAGARGEFTLRAEEAGHYVVVAGRATEPQVESDPMELQRSQVIDSIQLTVARGGRVLGTITADDGTRLVGSQVLTFDREGKSTRPTIPKPHPVTADGRFEIGRLPAGVVSFYWYPMGHTQFGADISGRPVGGTFIGDVEVVEDETTSASLRLRRRQ